MLRKQAEKGSALIIAVLFMMLRIASSGVVLMTISSHYFSNRSYRGTIISQYAARGGLGYVGYTLNMSTAINRIANVVHFGGRDVGAALALLLLLCASLPPFLYWVATGRRPEVV